MNYKGKKVNRHRFRQLTKTRDNLRKMNDEMFFAFHPSAVDKMRDFLKDHYTVIE